jgi:hemerythrin superfamily protein
MATARKPGSTTARRASRAASAPLDAIALLKADHQKVSALFAQLEKSRSPAKKQALVATICRELSIHATVEEEIFYPAVKAALKDKELVPEALVEHATLKEFIAKVDGKAADGEMFDAQLQVMSEYVKHHVKEEQTQMFPKARNTKLDMAELGQRIAERKQQLMENKQALPKEPTAVAELLQHAPAA